MGESIGKTVLLLASEQVVCPNGAALIEQANKARTPEQPPQDPYPSDTFSPDPAAVDRLHRFYQQEVIRLLSRYPHSDLHRVDYTIAKQIALANPGIAEHILVETIRANSPDIEHRKRGHVENYVRRTVTAVLADPEVQAHWQLRSQRQLPERKA